MSIGKFSFVIGVLLCAAMVAALLVAGVPGLVAALVAPVLVIICAYVGERVG